MVRPCVPTYRPAYSVSVSGFPFRLVAGMVNPAYVSSISYTPILAHRRYIAAIPTDQMPVMMSFPA